MEELISIYCGLRFFIETDQSTKLADEPTFWVHHNPDSIAWQPVGLPPDYYPLFAPHRQAFIQPGDKTVAHGGPSIEEVIVPWIQISKRSL